MAGELVEAVVGEAGGLVGGHVGDAVGDLLEGELLAFAFAGLQVGDEAIAELDDAAFAGGERVEGVVESAGFDGVEEGFEGCELEDEAVAVGLVGLNLVEGLDAPLVGLDGSVGLAVEDDGEGFGGGLAGGIGGDGASARER